MTENKINEAVALLRACPVSYLATVEDGGPSVRPMMTARVDDDGTVWYATGATSAKMRQVAQNPKVCVSVYQDLVDVRVYGTAEIVGDPAVKAELWQDGWAQYFGSKDDPSYGLIKITPTRVMVHGE
ncbi:MAG: pyridoxamine 5'-phosphate oxidase family protein [Armatimonadota bacterium]